MNYNDREEQVNRYQRYQHAYEWLGAPWSDMRLQKKTLANFDASQQKEAVDALYLFLDELRGTFIYYGPFGTGKTHLLAALCNTLIERGETPRFATSLNLFAAIQDRISSHRSHADIILSASTCPLLVLDDVDKAKWSDFREETYFAIIDNRVKRELPTALSTNRLTDLASFVGGAVASRLTIGQLAVEMAGSDYRPTLK